MKALIWFGCIFVATILNTLLGELTGIKIGYVLFYFGVYFVASKLCRKWDEHKLAKRTKEQQSADDGAGNNRSANSAWHCDCGRVHPAFETRCVCGVSKLDRRTAKQQPVSVKEMTNKICFCRKCGEKLLDESRFCRMCGTQVVE